MFYFFLYYLKKNKILEFYDNVAVDLNDPLFYHRLVEAIKFGYAERYKLEDTYFLDDDSIINHLTNQYSFLIFYYKLISSNF